MTLDDQPTVERLACGCVVNTFEDTVRTDFCGEHAKASEGKL